jgi:DNA (cytosine-5)-methyltransferase 1
MIKIGDLFAGIGGIALGFKKAGFNIVWANEMDHNACITYRYNFKHTLYECTIQTLQPEKLPRIDMLTGGFPCQAFSIAGYQKGFEDTRGTLFFEIMRLVDVLNPKYIFLENVKNLEHHDTGKTFKIILNELHKREYFVKYKVMNTYEYSSVPQNRERIYIIAFKDKNVYEAFKFPKKTKKIKKITDLLEKDVDKSFYYSSKFKKYTLLKNGIKDPNTIYQWRRVYLRENKNGLCPTLTANMGMGGHNVPLILDNIGIRKLTPRECARFQGFPEKYKLPKLANSALYKQLGNSVSVPVVRSIAKEIMRAIKKAGS